MVSLYYFFVVIFLLAIWLLIVYLVFLAIQNRRHRIWLSKQEYQILLLKVPKNNEKGALSAEQLYSSLHGIYRDKWSRFVEGSLQEHISFEIVSSSKYIKFYVYAPKNLVEFVEGQLYAQYPTLLVEKVDDYVNEYKYDDRSYASCELVLDRDQAYPIRTFETFEVDPLAGITAVMSKLGDINNQIWLQFLMRPADNSWQKNSLSQVAKIRGQLSGTNIVDYFFNLSSLLFKHIVSSGSDSVQSNSSVKSLSGPETEAIGAIEKKVTKLGYQVKIRIITFGDNPADAKSKLQSVISTFKQFNITNLNGFSARRIIINNNSEVESYKKRSFWNNGYILNVSELASLFHLPSINVATPAIVWSTSKVAEPPSNLPTVQNTVQEDLTVFAKTDFRGLENNFGILTEDRSKHLYIVGKTGMGKTSLLQNMVIDDIRKGRGVAVVDPHGDFVDTVLNYIPSYRINDVVLFDAGDRENPVAFNLLENVADDYKPIIASGLIAVFKKIWGDSWGPRLEHILRYTFLALLDYPGSTFLSVPRILTDENFRNVVIEKIKDPIVRDFWQTEFAGYTEKMRQEAISPIQNKIGQFLASPTIRNIVGQPVTSMNIRDIMDSKKIFLVKVAKGVVGEDNSALLGAMMITKIQLAAMSRADTPIDKRVPFNLFVDEFQNFATESFASILSEARKYSLNLHVANQYIDQMEDEVREAVFGNVGTLITFRVGASDSDYLSKEFAPVFTPEDITNLEKYHIYLRMTINGISSPPFSAVTLPLPSSQTSSKEKAIHGSRERYSTDRKFVENKIKDWTESLDVIKEKNVKDRSGNKKRYKNNYNNFNRNNDRKDYHQSDLNTNKPKDEKKEKVDSPEDIKKKELLLEKLKSFQESRGKNVDVIKGANNSNSLIDRLKDRKHLKNDIDNGKKINSERSNNKSATIEINDNDGEGDTIIL